MVLLSFSNLITEEEGAYRSESVYVYKYPVIPEKKNINFNVMDEQTAMEKNIPSVNNNTTNQSDEVKQGTFTSEW